MSCWHSNVLLAFKCPVKPGGSAIAFRFAPRVAAELIRGELLTGPGRRIILILIILKMLIILILIILLLIIIIIMT
jgi:hypothetical protein